MKGLFIVLEGIDGSGTTTQAEQLARWVEEQGRTVLLTREPTPGPVGRFLREALARKIRDENDEPVELDWTAMALLFSADRMDHVRRQIEPALLRSEVVICDRYDLSSLLYQSLTSKEGAEAVPWLGQLNARALRPDLTLVLDIPAEVAEERRASRGGEPELYERAELQRKLADGYRQAQKYLPQDEIYIVDANSSIATVQLRLRTIIEQSLSA